VYTITSVGMALTLSLVASDPCVARLIKTTTNPPETVETSTYYDSASRRLTLTCDRASRGLCRFSVVDGTRTTKFALRPTARASIAGVSRQARVCAVGRNPGAACNLVSVSA
jgi:hypothetical protein